jgi:hypothetical protein
MALPTPLTLTASVRYFKAGTTRYIFVPTLVSKAAPTLAEVSAGTDLTSEVVAGSVNGFNTSSEKLDVPDAGTRFTSSIPGRITSDDSAMTFYASSTGTDARGTFSLGLNGYMLICHEGLVTSAKCDVFPVRVGSVSPEQDTEDSGKITVTFFVTSAPAAGVPIPVA